MTASFRTARDCFYCSARRVSCQCSPAIRRRALVDMEHAQPLDFTSESERRGSDMDSLRRWAEGHQMRRTGTFSSQAALTYYSSDKSVPVSTTTISLYWTVGGLSARRAAGLRAGLAAQMQPSRARIMTPSMPSAQQHVAARPPRRDAVTDVCDADASSRAARLPVKRTKRRAAAGEAPPVQVAGAHIDANGVRRRRRRRGGHHALYYEAAVLGGIQPLDDVYIRRGVRTETVVTDPERLLAQQARLSGSSCSSGRSEQSATCAAAGPRRPPPFERVETETSSTASASLRLSAGRHASARAAATLRDPVSDRGRRDGGGISTETTGDDGGGVCISGGSSGGADQASTLEASATDSGVAKAGTTLNSETFVSDSTWDGSSSPLEAPLFPFEGVPDVSDAVLPESDPFTSLEAIPTYDRDGVSGAGCWEDMFVPALWTEPVEDLDGCGGGGGGHWRLSRRWRSRLNDGRGWRMLTRPRSWHWCCRGCRYPLRLEGLWLGAWPPPPTLDAMVIHRT